jgi:molybdopterin-guanine dinucleotide biosynthesis protein A
MAVEDKLDELGISIDRIVEKVKRLEKEKKECYIPTINEKKNSHLHILIETSLMNKVEKKAKEKRISIAEFVRNKLREQEQLDRIEGKIDKLIK